MLEERIISRNSNDFNPELVNEYPLITLKSNTFVKKKIRYNNYDEQEKTLNIYTTDIALLKIFTKELTIPEKGYSYIRFAFDSPQSVGEFTAHIIIDKQNITEEILKFKIKTFFHYHFFLS